MAPAVGAAGVLMIVVICQGAGVGEYYCTRVNFNSSLAGNVAFFGP